jgi:hypothetical protein
MASSPPPPIRTSGYRDEETEGEGSPLLPRRSGGVAVAFGDGGGATSEAASTGGEEGLLYARGSGSGSGGDRLTMTTAATEGSGGGGGGGGRDASVMRALWASSGSHSDSAIPSSSASARSPSARRRGLTGSREMLDPA